jgi:hypothetical protein
MLAAVVPSVNGKWEVKEVPTPQAGTNQVLIKIHASGICYTDVHITKGGLGVKFPHTIGHEPAGNCWFRWRCNNTEFDTLKLLVLKQLLSHIQKIRKN